MSIIAPSSPDNSATSGASSSLFENTLSKSGYAYLLGDAALAIAKTMEGDKNGLRGALLWGAGGLVTAQYGNPTAEKQLQLLERRLGDYLKKQHISIPNHPLASEMAKENGLIEQCEAFLYRYPSELLNSVYAIGGALTFKGGMSGNKKNTMDMACGALVMAGALAGLLIKEKAPDPNHPATGMLGKVREWAQESPLGVSAGFYHLNNIPLIIGGFTQKKANKATGNYSHWFRFLTAGSYIFANIMLSMSSKNNTDLRDMPKDHSMLGALADKAALVLAAQPPEVQEVLIENVAGYLSSQRELHHTAAEISAMMREKLASLQQQPVMAGIGMQR